MLRVALATHIPPLIQINVIQSPWVIAKRFVEEVMKRRVSLVTD
jgi:hypothetical protein